MPLKKPKKGASKAQKQKIAGENIGELIASYKKTGKIGRSKPKSKKAAYKQATAIGLKSAGISKKK